MNGRALRADGLLLVTAAIWGLAFVAQRLGMDHVGPMTYNGIRFALGGLALLPLIGRLDRNRPAGTRPRLRLVAGGGLLGLILFCGASLQQIGLAGPQLARLGFEASSAGKAGFITGLYVVLVPLLGLGLGHRPGLGTWCGAGLALAGLYLLSVTGPLRMAAGDALVLAGAFFWAGHVLLVARLSPGLSGADAVRLSILQFAVCALLSLGLAAANEEITLAGLRGAALPIAYGGLLSVGVAYTLQVIAQRDAPPAHAAILLSLEGVFAVAGGWLLLGETLGVRALVGCALMLAGMLFSQLRP